MPRQTGRYRSAASRAGPIPPSAQSWAATARGGQCGKLVRKAGGGSAGAAVGAAGDGPPIPRRRGTALEVSADGERYSLIEAPFHLAQLALIEAGLADHGADQRCVDQLVGRGLGRSGRRRLGLVVQLAERQPADHCGGNGRALELTRAQLPGAEDQPAPAPRASGDIDRARVNGACGEALIGGPASDR